jgi:hypothetical protein
MNCNSEIDMQHPKYEMRVHLVDLEMDSSGQNGEGDFCPQKLVNKQSPVRKM